MNRGSTSPTRSSTRRVLGVAAAVLLTAALGVADFAEAAKRVGGGRNTGRQSESAAQRATPRTPPQDSNATNRQAAPQNNAAPGQGTNAGTAAGAAGGAAAGGAAGAAAGAGAARSATPNAAQNPAAATARTGNPAASQQPARRNGWLGPIAGLAAGLGLAALFSHLGLGEELATAVMLGLLVMFALLVVRWLMTRRRRDDGRGATGFRNERVAFGGRQPQGAFGGEGRSYGGASRDDSGRDPFFQGQQGQQMDRGRQPDRARSDRVSSVRLIDSDPAPQRAAMAYQPHDDRSQAAYRTEPSTQEPSTQEPSTQEPSTQAAHAPSAGHPSSTAWSGTASSHRQQAPGAGSIPPDFDGERFVRSAKICFMRLQSAFDEKQVEAIRELTSHELFEELERDLSQRGEEQHRTDVVTLNGELAAVERAQSPQGPIEVASVRFNGLLREAPNPSATPFDEIWNFTRPLDQSSGWVLAGIQQVDSGRTH